MARGKPNAGASGTQASAKTSRAPRKPRPSVEFVEISSSEVADVPLGKGAARGLSEKNVISTARASVEDTDGEGEERHADTNRRVTRGARHGRTDDRINYDLKYHPMDEVTRPANAARRRSGSRSASAPRFKAEDGDTSEASLPTSAAGSEDEASDEGSDVEELPMRTPDPRAVRHSTRAEANKNVDYSRKHHPQDYALPGHQRKAKILKRAEKKRKRGSMKHLSSGIQTSGPGKTDRHEIVVDDSEDPDEMNEDEDEIDQVGPPSKRPSKPQKRLRVLPDDRSSSPRKSWMKKLSKRRSYQGKRAEKSDPVLGTMSDGEMGAFDDSFADDFPNQDGKTDQRNAAQELNRAIGGAQASSSSGRNLASRVEAKKTRPFAGIDMFTSEDEEDGPDEEDDSHVNREQSRSQRKKYAEEDEESVHTEDDEDDDPTDNDDKDGETRVRENDACSISQIRQGADQEMDDVDDSGNETGNEQDDETSNPSQLSSPGKTMAGAKPKAFHRPLNKATARITSTSSTAFTAPSSTFKDSSRQTSGNKSASLRSDVEEQAEVESEVASDGEEHADQQSRRLAQSQGQSSRVKDGEHENLRTKSSTDTPATLLGVEGMAKTAGTGPLQTSAHAALVPANSMRSTTRNNIGQLVSPMATHGKMPMADPTPSQVSGGLASKDANDHTARSQDGRESSPAGLQSAHATPRQVLDEVPPTQRSRKNALLPSDPHGAPDRDEEAVSWHSSQSPSKFLYSEYD